MKIIKPTMKLLVSIHEFFSSEDNNPEEENLWFQTDIDVTQFGENDFTECGTYLFREMMDATEFFTMNDDGERTLVDVTEDELYHHYCNGDREDFHAITDTETPEWVLYGEGFGGTLFEAN